MNPKVDAYLDSVQKWQEELVQLRNIVLDCQLTEELKWGVPCYVYQKKNIVLIHAFKEYCALLFFNGALLKDDHHLLIRQSENVQAGRQIRFTDVNQILEKESLLKAYIFEAMEAEKAGLKIVLKKTADFTVPEEFQQRLDTDSALHKAFHALTPGRQRAYLLHFAAPKQSQTRAARIDKYIPRIFNGKGLTDCVCGLSKKMPACDGSHKFAR
jgi:uncharacterized protein YdeI (YjbR/CyaY-like superfamily)